ncbi:NAD(P)-dependent oxidoreductase [Umezawaea sp. NPDC059074]|uniref:NAD(P)-dependent oxidoreductase n=1 Tax=Umezawaea sp. NPDC059074 TaxID=3346716 RepID=UPI0036ACBF98
MEITILAASGATGRELTRQALERGHTVTAIARTPANIAVPDSPRLIRVAADVRDPRSIGEALAGRKIVLSGLGIASGDKPGALTAGAHALVAAQPQRAIWLGAFGTGPSARAAGAATRTLLKVMGEDKLTDKAASDAAVLAAGGTVFHAGPLSDGPLSPTRRTVGLGDAPHRFFPARVSRATVAAAMLDEAEDPTYPGTIAIPLER